VSRVRIELVVEGGVAYLPGLARPFVVDSDSLAAEEAGRLLALVESSGVLRRAAREREGGSAGGRRGPAAEGGADRRSYRITVDDGSRRRTLSLSDPLPPRLVPLVDFLRRKQREGRRSANGAVGGGHGDE
jgi:hypothetical protein